MVEHGTLVSKIKTKGNQRKSDFLLLGRFHKAVMTPSERELNKHEEFHRKGQDFQTEGAPTAWEQRCGLPSLLRTRHVHCGPVPWGRTLEVIFAVSLFCPSHNPSDSMTCYSISKISINPMQSPPTPTPHFPPCSPHTVFQALLGLAWETA